MRKGHENRALLVSCMAVGLAVMGNVTLAAMTQIAAPERADPVVLSLPQAVEYALEDNPALKGATIECEIARWEVKGGKAYWEPELVLASDYESNARENTIEQELSQFDRLFEEENMSYNTAVEGSLMSGARYRIGCTVSDLANSLTNLTFREVKPFESQYTAFAGISIAQPLLKNFGPTSTRKQLKTGLIKFRIARQELRRQKMITIARAEVAYWGAWQAQQIAQLRAQSLQIARDLVDDTEKRLAEGQIAAIEVDQARAGLALRERRWLQAERARQDAERDLVSVLNWEVGSCRVEVDVGETPPVPAVEPDFETQVYSAHKYHPDMLIAQAEIEWANLLLKLARNQRLPQLDLTASYGMNGLGADMNEAFNDVGSGDFESWSAGVVLRMPLASGLNERARVNQARLQCEKAGYQRETTETEVANALRSVIHKVELLRRTVKALEDEAEINRMAMESEKLLFESGKGTSRRLLEQEDDLSDSRVESVTATAVLLKAHVELDLADGGMLLRRGLEGDGE